MKIKKIKEAIVVEGKDDEAAVLRAFDALIIKTHGFGISDDTWSLLDKADREKGLIILTDPDHAGEDIRKRLTARFPAAKQAFLSRDKAYRDSDVGVENAEPQAIASAIEKARCTAEAGSAEEISMEQLTELGLAGTADAALMRAKTAEALGIGYGNCKAFIKKLKTFGIGIEELTKKTEQIYKKNKKHSHGNKTAGFRHAKSLGQNFLTDENIAETIAEKSNITDKTLVVEIGPGDGALTARLLERAAKVVAIELDERLIPVLEERFSQRDDFEVIHEDILKTDLNKIISEQMKETGAAEARIIGNLPYYITTPIIMKLLEEKIAVKSITAMMQKEVAERLEAMPGTRAAGAITYNVHYHCDILHICSADRTCFCPAPNVDSAVLRFDIREEKAVSVKDEEIFFSCIRAGFSKRRKMLKSALAGAAGLDREETGEVLKRAGISPSLRAENLTLQDFADIANTICEIRV